MGGDEARDPYSSGRSPLSFVAEDEEVDAAFFVGVIMESSWSGEMCTGYPFDVRVNSGRAPGASAEEFRRTRARLRPRSEAAGRDAPSLRLTSGSRRGRG